MLHKESSPRSWQLEKAQCSNKDPAQPRINNFFKIRGKWGDTKVAVCRMVPMSNVAKQKNPNLDIFGKVGTLHGVARPAPLGAFL